MIYYDHLPLDKDILKALGELSIDNDAAKRENVRKLVIEFDKRRMTRATIWQDRHNEAGFSEYHTFDI